MKRSRRFSGRYRWPQPFPASSKPDLHGNEKSRCSCKKPRMPSLRRGGTARVREEGGKTLFLRNVKVIALQNSWLEV